MHIQILTSFICGYFFLVSAQRVFKSLCNDSKNLVLFSGLYPLVVLVIVSAMSINSMSKLVIIINLLH